MLKRVIATQRKNRLNAVILNVYIKLEKKEKENRQLKQKIKRAMKTT